MADKFSKVRTSDDAGGVVLDEPGFMTIAMARGVEGPRAEAYKAALRLLSGKESYVYFSVSDGQYTEADVSVVGHVADLEHQAGHLWVRFTEVATPMVLLSSHPNFAGFAKTLGLSRHGLLQDSDGKPQVVAMRLKPSTAEIIALDAKPELVPRSCAPAGLMMTRKALAASLPATSLTGAESHVRQQMSAGVATTEGPAFPKPIPYSYLWSYCWLRAELTARALFAAGVQSGKLWVTPVDSSKTIRLRTKLLPGCCTDWTYHVVTVVKGQDNLLYVIDPPFFSNAVDLDLFVESLGVEVHTQFSDQTAYELTDIHRPVPLGACENMVEAHWAEAWAALGLLKSASGSSWPPCP